MQYVLLYVCVPMTQQLCGGHRTTVRVFLFFMRVTGFKSGPQAWLPVPLPAEPSCWYSTFLNVEICFVIQLIINFDKCT